MRRLIGALLAATILAPAAAQAQREGYRGEAAGRVERGGVRGDRGDRAGRVPDGGRPDVTRADQPRPGPRSYEAPGGDGRRDDRWAGAGRGDGVRDRSGWGRDRGDDGRVTGVPRGADLRAGRPDDGRRFRDGGADENRRGGDWTSSRFDSDRRDWRGDGRGGWDRGDRGRDGWTDRGRNGIGWSNRDGNRWDRGWHGQSRYDWTRYRDANRGAFRLPRYYAPGGWNGGYRRFGIGFSLSSALWARNYWIADPYAYRLPDAYGPYRWVRYYDDALLVDIDSGQVVDAVYGIFW